MTASWIDGLGSESGDGHPLHAGALTDLCLGNLDRLLSQSGYRIQSIPHDIVAAGDRYARHELTESSVWEDLTAEWGGYAAPIRQVEDGGYRQLTVGIYGRVKTAGAVGTVRISAFPFLRESLRFHTDDGFVGRDYGELIFTSTTGQWKWTTISIGDTETGWARGYATVSDGEPTTMYEEISIHGICMLSTTGVGEYVDLYSPSVEEAP